MELENIPNRIISEHISCVFVSPHLDDAVLSAGELISYLALHTQVKVITIFTEASKEPATLSAGRFLRQCGYKDAETLFNQRKFEDKQVFKRINVQVEHLGFIDAAWRRKAKLSFNSMLFSAILPEFAHIYPTHRFHIAAGKIAEADFELMEAIEKKLLSQLPKDGKYFMFCPLAGSIHVDHVITREVCRKVAQNLIYWSDYPYSQTNQLNAGSLKELNVPASVNEVNFRIKQEMLSGYSSQFKLLFPDNIIPRIKEVFYI